jgi:hypothetical protein
MSDRQSSREEPDLLLGAVLVGNLETIKIV